MKPLNKEIRKGLCKLYGFDYDGALDAGVIEPEMQIQNLLPVITRKEVILLAERKEKQAKVG